MTPLEKFLEKVESLAKATLEARYPELSKKDLTCNINLTNRTVSFFEVKKTLLKRFDLTENGDVVEQKEGGKVDE